MTDRFIVQATAFGAAVFFTLSLLASIDMLAVEQHAATTLATSTSQPAQTAAVKTPAKRS